ncbi:MAG TPA: ribonuclease III, partial [Candidatus Binatia bacterium]|nr:ribonuclease III [Candidatus Binatia bacterium]
MFELQDKIGIAFRDPSLLHEALTHSSYANENPESSPRDNERLEYLGDAVLQLISAEYLYKRRPEAREGEMTQVRSAMVNTNALASLAEELGLGNYLFLGKGIAKGGGRGLRSLLANSFEAVLGAIFLDAGYDAAYHYCLERFQALPDGVQDENFKGRLQQLVQERYGVTPFYDSIGARGQGGRSREYTAVVYAVGEPLGTGYGRSKQAAEQGAAKDAIDKLVGDTPSRSRGARRGRRRGRGEEPAEPQPGTQPSEDAAGAWPVEAERGPARQAPVAVEAVLHAPLPPGDGVADETGAANGRGAADVEPEPAGQPEAEPGAPEPRRRRSRRSRSRESATSEAAASVEGPAEAEPPRPRQFGEPVPAEAPPVAEAPVEPRPASRQGGRGRRRSRPVAELVPVLEPAELPESQTSPRSQSEPEPEPPRQLGQPVAAAEAAEVPAEEPPRPRARRSRSRRTSAETQEAQAG